MNRRVYQTLTTIDGVRIGLTKRVMFPSYQRLLYKP